MSACAGFVIPGGVSYQDRVRAGAVAAKDPLLRVLLEAEDDGVPALTTYCRVVVRIVP